MVQLRPPESFEYEPDKDYWKLIRPKGLTNKKLSHDIRAMSSFRCPTLPREHLCRLFTRIQRGLPVYEKYRLADLVKFIHDRRVKVRTFQPTQLIKRLIDADEHFIFMRFQDLPPEIRLEIYEIYMASLKCKSTFAPPPITLVSKAIRRESLPVFASLFMKRERHFWCQIKKHDTLTPGLPDSIPTDGMSKYTQAFWSRAPEAFIRHVQQLRVIGPVIEDWTVYIALTIDLSARAQERRLVFEIAGVKTGHPNETKARETAGRIINALQKLVEDIDARERPIFRREDAQHIVNAFGVVRNPLQQGVDSRDLGKQGDQ